MHSDVSLLWRKGKETRSCCTSTLNLAGSMPKIIIDIVYIIIPYFQVEMKWVRPPLLLETNHYIDSSQFRTSALAF